MSAISQSESSHLRLLFLSSSAALPSLNSRRSAVVTINLTAVMVDVVAAKAENKQCFPGDSTYNLIPPSARATKYLFATAHDSE